MVIKKCGGFMKISEIEKIEQRLLTQEKYRSVYNKMMSDVIYQVGRMTKEARVRKGISQSELAKKMKTHQSAIARIESGKLNVSLGFLSRIAKALGTQLLPPRFKFMQKQYDPEKRIEKLLKSKNIVAMTANGEECELLSNCCNASLSAFIPCTNGENYCHICSSCGKPCEVHIHTWQGKNHPRLRKIKKLCSKS